MGLLTNEPVARIDVNNRRLPNAFRVEKFF